MVDHTCPPTPVTRYLSDPLRSSVSTSGRREDPLSSGSVISDFSRIGDTLGVSVLKRLERDQSGTRSGPGEGRGRPGTKWVLHWTPPPLWTPRCVDGKSVEVFAERKGP